MTFYKKKNIKIHVIKCVLTLQKDTSILFLYIQINRNLNLLRFYLILLVKIVVFKRKYYFTFVQVGSSRAQGKRASNFQPTANFSIRSSLYVASKLSLSFNENHIKNRSTVLEIRSEKQKGKQTKFQNYLFVFQYLLNNYMHLKKHGYFQNTDKQLINVIVTDIKQQQ